MTIFVVDDDESFRRSVTRLLRAKGYEAREFASAAELPVEAIHSDDCMLVDCRIAFGQNLLEHLAEIDAPIVLMSGSEIETIVSALGTRPCLLKPFNRKQLRQAIEAATGNTGLIPRKTPSEKIQTET